MYVSILSEKTSMHKIKKLFADLCCSECGAEFDENSVSILREEEGLLVLQVICNNCQKSFGVAILGFNPTSFADKDEDDDDILEVQQTPSAINYDDVLDAHNFIQGLESDWMKYIPDRYKD